jgi:2-polyprenyl-3-methyl-5-hydroxy-6-metoxy-1,4-benzoquinol methylase
MSDRIIRLESERPILSPDCTQGQPLWRLPHETPGTSLKQDIDMVNASSSNSVEHLYGQAYYESHCGGLIYGRQEAHWARFFGAIAEHVVRTLQPRLVFDAGCAHGFLLEALHDRGVDVAGRDISAFAISQIRDDIRPGVEQGSIADDIAGSYDLITCIEVLEHMAEREALLAIAAMAAATDQILFSSSPSDLTEPTHINVRPILWWLERFSVVGFAPVVDYDASFVTAHAYLLKRSARKTSPAELGAFAEVLGKRVARHERKARLARISSIFVKKLRRIGLCALVAAGILASGPLAKADGCSDARGTAQRTAATLPQVANSDAPPSIRWEQSIVTFPRIVRADHAVS